MVNKNTLRISRKSSAIPPRKLPGKLQHKGVQGARLPGWPEVNCERLSEEMDCHPMHLRNVMTGRTGTTLAYIERIAVATGITAAEVVERIVQARGEDAQRLERVNERWLARQQGKRSVGR